MFMISVQETNLLLLLDMGLESSALLRNPVLTWRIADAR
jgi:hypothetical protein